MNINLNKLDKLKNKDVEIINLHLKSKNYINNKNIFKAWHMNKEEWVSVLLDDSLSDEFITNLIDLSFESIK
jgi:predicted DNA-binding protein (MmcQ/YjbR family)